MRIEGVEPSLSACKADVITVRLYPLIDYNTSRL